MKIFDEGPYRKTAVDHTHRSIPSSGGVRPNPHHRLALGRPGILFFNFYRNGS